MNALVRAACLALGALYLVCAAVLGGALWEGAVPLLLVSLARLAVTAWFGAGLLLTLLGSSALASLAPTGSPRPITLRTHAPVRTSRRSTRPRFASASAHPRP
jgi:hypothetical protein